MTLQKGINGILAELLKNEGKADKLPLDYYSAKILAYLNDRGVRKVSLVKSYSYRCKELMK